MTYNLIIYTHNTCMYLQNENLWFAYERGAVISIKVPTESDTISHQDAMTAVSQIMEIPVHGRTVTRNLKHNLLYDFGLHGRSPRKHIP